MMKIALPVDEKNMETTVCPSFGRAPYFLIYDTDSNDYIFYDNNAAVSQGGAGIKAAQSLVDNQVNALLTPRCGENAAQVLKAAGIKLYKTVSASVMDNVNAFNDDKLSLLNEIHPGFHRRGGAGS
jgi:predicted Fe-Mo cluster-binding NifX family protein